MIWPSDGLRLAVTKIKTRRFRLGLTLFISSLLFIAVTGVLFTVRGVVGSLKDYSKEGLGSRYIITAQSQGVTFNLFEDKDVIARTKVLDKEYLASRKAEAKKLQLDYDAATEVPAVTVFDGPNGKVENVNTTSYAGKKAVDEYLAAHPVPGLPELKALTSGYDLINTYRSQRISFGDTQTYLKVLKDGKEDLDPENASQNTGSPSDLENFSTNWQAFDEDIIKPFVLPGQSLAKTDDGAIPILAPYSSLEKILGLNALPKGSSGKEKLARLEEIRTKAAGFDFSVCYRNSASQDRVNLAVSMQQEIARNKSTKDYVKPDLVYALPADACADIKVERDVRTAEVKKQAEKEATFAKTFGAADPVTKILTFKIVGIVPDAGDGSASTVQQILQSILSSTIGSGWFTANSVVESDPLLKTIFAPNLLFGTNEQLFAEFANADSARRFTDEQNCNPEFVGVTFSGPGAVATKDDSNPFTACNAAGKYFFLYPFGSNSLALNEFEKGFNKVFRVFLIIIMVIAALIMMGIVARVIADSRRETAVFRAIGAKRLDIAQIYLTYIAIICVFIALIATFGGMLIGVYLKSRYATDMRIASSIAFNASDTTRAFSFSKVLPADLLLVWGVVFAVGIASSLLPLLANLRRNPIRDMRDER